MWRRNMMDNGCRFMLTFHWRGTSRLRYLVSRKRTRRRRGRKLCRWIPESLINDRIIQDALGIGKQQGFQEKIIVEGELLLYDETAKRISEFHELNKYLDEPNEPYIPYLTNLISVTPIQISIS